MVEIGSGAMKDLCDLHLTRYACYLIVQNADKKDNKEENLVASCYYCNNDKLDTFISELFKTILDITGTKHLILCLKTIT